MYQFVLTDGLLTGLDSIDLQHRTLLELAERAASDRFAHYAGERLKNAMAACVGYAQRHFTAEEQLMQGIDSPGFQAHRLSHEYFLTEICELVDAAQLLGVTAAIRERLARMIWHDFREHIRLFDQQLALYAKTRVDPRQLDLTESGTLVKAASVQAVDAGDWVVGMKSTVR
jgi:hemerythrin-like metal-binding protein